MFEPQDTLRLHSTVGLALKGIGLASPNPLVGCVIVTDRNEVVGQGFHLYDLRDHAEIVALKQAGERARGASLFVNLEPCNHKGRTGPCTGAIISAGIRRVFVGMRDPNPNVTGRGIERLRGAGIEVVVASGEDQEIFERLNESFSHWAVTGKPFVTLKSALTLDGQLALPKSRKSKKRERITSEESRAEVHRMRHASDALLTGIGTILADNPFLTDRSGLERRRRLLRIVLDTHLRLPPKSRIVQTADDDLLVFTAAPLKSPKARALQNAGVELIHTKKTRAGLDLPSILKELARRDILTVLLEAGPTLNAAALNAKIVNKLVLFYAPKLSGTTPVPFLKDARLDVSRLTIRTIRQFGPDVAIEVHL